MRRSRGQALSVSLPSVVTLGLGASCYGQCDYLSESLQEQHAWARIQQRQLQEKEQKLLQLYESQQQRALDRVVTRSTSLSSSLSSSSSFTALGTSVRATLSNGLSTSNGSGNGKPLVVGAGRVRQMFDERRKPNNSAPAATGWDRSHPLEPIAKPAAAQKPATKQRGGASQDRTGALQKAPPSVAAAPAHQPLRKAKSQARAAPAALAPTPTPAPPQPDSPPPPPADEDLQRYLDDLTPPPSPPQDDEDQEQTDEPDGPTPDDADDATAATAFVFQKLPNVGGPARAPVVQLAEERPDRFKTYAAGRPAPRDKGTARGQPAAKPPARRTEVKASPPAVSTAAAPMAAKRSTTSRGSASPQQFYPATRTASNASTPSPSHSKSSATSNTSTPAKKSPAGAASTGAATNRPRVSGSASTSGAPLRAVATAPPQDDLVDCSICGRRFATDRVAKHEEICRRTATKKRKVFDPVKHRVQGTEAEAFVRKMLLKGPSTKKETQAKKADWRKKHEEFINTIRAAKEMKAHLAAGGKLSDLPPPPPLDTSDYIQCPHCKRRFNESAAERHIPRCANMQHNKKPAQPTRASAGKVGARRR